MGQHIVRFHESSMKAAYKNTGKHTNFARVGCGNERIWNEFSQKYCIGWNQIVHYDANDGADISRMRRHNASLQKNQCLGINEIGIDCLNTNPIVHKALNLEIEIHYDVKLMTTSLIDYEFIDNVQWTVQHMEFKHQTMQYIIL